mgnify:CR=1 FL=1
MLKNSKRLCVFAHFNPQFRVAEYVFYYLQRLHDDVNADIIFSSTSAIPTAVSYTHLTLPTILRV